MKESLSQINFWKKSAEENLEAALVLFKNKHYSSSLFFCHLALEKIIKGLVVKTTKKPAPYIHDLAKLADLAKMPLTSGQVNDLRIITTFNIAGRYQEMKFSFYKSINKKYSKKYLDATNALFIWLKKQYLKK